MYLTLTTTNDVVLAAGKPSTQHMKNLARNKSLTRLRIRAWLPVQFKQPILTIRTRRWLGILGGVSLVVLLNGCASPGASGGSDPLHYDVNTGYPAVGSGKWISQ